MVLPDMLKSIVQQNIRKAVPRFQGYLRLEILKRSRKKKQNIQGNFILFLIYFLIIKIKTTIQTKKLMNKFQIKVNI